MILQKKKRFQNGIYRIIWENIRICGMNEKRPVGEKEDISDDVVFEVELIRQIEINIDYMLMLVKKYHDTHCEDKDVLELVFIAKKWYNRRYEKRISSNKLRK